MAMRALDNQVARDWQKRAPEDRESLGVLKWEPINTRVENLSVFLLESFGDQLIGLDSLLIMSQAMAKSLQLIVDELGAEGLGEVRKAYCLGAAENISRDIARLQQALKELADFN
jgi:hypothetical protein